MILFGAKLGIPGGRQRAITLLFSKKKIEKITLFAHDYNKSNYIVMDSYI